MHFGAAWYPEHWPESRWPRDIELMQQAKFTVVRVGEFAWSTMEPKEGEFAFEWLDQAVALLDKAGIDVVMGTPTAAPPAWLTTDYPNTLSIGADGRPAEHGGRCHFRPLNATYLKFCRRIAGEMAKRYGRMKHVIGWQIDNEYNHNSHDLDTRRQFQDWLKVKYRTLKQLNNRWSGSYWSEDYQSWDQIPTPKGGGHNPGLMLEWQRFHTYTYRVYQKIQIQAIRKYADRRQWITTNLMGWFDLFDHYEMARDLDLAAWDSYWPAGTPDPVDDALPHDLTRGFKKKNFWLMETQPSSVNWGEINTMHEPGRIRLRNWQAVAHGADAILYWQWRNAYGGQEQLHGSLIGQDGHPRPCFDELAKLGGEFQKAAVALDGTTPHARVAFVNSYDARWAVRFQKHHRDYDWVGHFRAHYAPVFARHHAVDIVNAGEELTGYALVVAPALWLLSDHAAEILLEYVRAGGHLLITTRTGSKDTENAMRPALPPGPLAAIAGVEVEDAYPLVKPIGVNGTLGSGRARVWAERLRIIQKDVQVLATFGTDNGWLEGRAAVATRRAGKGRMTTLAGWFEPALLDRIMARALADAGLKPRFSGPPGVEFALRSGADRRATLIVMNHGEKAARLSGLAGRNVLTGRNVAGSWTLAARDVAVIRLA